MDSAECPSVDFAQLCNRRQYIMLQKMGSILQCNADQSGQARAQQGGKSMDRTFGPNQIL